MHMLERIPSMLALQVRRVAKNPATAITLIQIRPSAILHITLTGQVGVRIMGRTVTRIGATNRLTLQGLRPRLPPSAPQPSIFVFRGMGMLSERVRMRISLT